MPIILLVAAAVAVIAPAGAGASTVGSIFAPGSQSCLNGSVAFQTVSPSSAYLVPADGVLTSWSYQAASTPPTNLKLEVAREVAPNQFFIIGNSANKTPVANTTNTYTVTPIPVQAGDILGERAVGESKECGLNGAGNTVRYVDSSDPKPGEIVELPVVATASLLLDISATLNAPPTAIVGPDQEVGPGAAVSLDGGGSTDPDGDTLSYFWQQATGIPVNLSGAKTAKPTFTAPKAAGSQTFELEICDTTFQCDSDSVVTTVKDEPPTANAGPDQEVESGVGVLLNGTGSTDPNGNSLLNEWKQTVGTPVGLIAPNSAKPGFTSPIGPTTLVFELKSCDAPSVCGVDSVAVVVKPLDTGPASATPDTSLKSTKIAERKVTFKFGSNEAGSAFLCKLDKKAFASCKSPKTYKNLQPGKHKFQVKARNGQGKLDPSPVVKKFEI